MYEDAAAAILDRSAGTLRNWRSSGAGSALPFYRSGRTGRVRYRLTDLAELLEVQRPPTRNPRPAREAARCDRWR